jgi:hypothetical protein
MLYSEETMRAWPAQDIDDLLIAFTGEVMAAAADPSTGARG